MKNSRNQLVVAIIFALLLGLVIVAAARCSSSGTATPKSTTPAKTATAKTTPGAKTTGTVTVVAGKTTEVPIVPPGSQTAPSATPISVGPLPATTPLPAVTVTGQGTGTGTGTGSTSLPTAIPYTGGTTSNPPAGLTYTVKAGDTLSSIAKTYGVTTAAIQQANNIADPSKIVVGQRIIIPGVTGPAASGTTMTTTTSSSGQKIYIVQRGDYLSKIAVRFGTTVAALVKANNISNPSKIYAGQKLIIP
jgi:lysozyme